MSELVSVLLPVYNVENFIHETLNSLLKQTYQNFEIIVVDDKSTDNTVEKILQINDPRIKLIINEKNMGRAGSDNVGMEYARGEYIAKMDGDDICHPERLARQVKVLNSRPDINVVGCWLQNFGASNYLHRYPVTPEELKVKTLFTLPGGNNCFMMRIDLYKERGMSYDASLRQTEDYDFFVRYIDELSILTIPEPLVKYRVLPRAIKHAIFEERAKVSTQIQKHFFESWGMNVSEKELNIHSMLSFLEYSAEFATPHEFSNWINRIIEHNYKFPKFDSKYLKLVLAERWFEIFYAFIGLGQFNIKNYKNNYFFKLYKPSFYKNLKLYSKNLLRKYYG